MERKHAYLVGKGRSLDTLDKGAFKDPDAEVWCVNQAASRIAALGLPNKLVCVQNDGWINYAPPEGMEWLHGPSVDSAGRDAVVYRPEDAGDALYPTCVCALHLMHARGIRSVTMIGFDSYFDGSRDYAACLDVKSDRIAPFHWYNKWMRRKARELGMELEWMDRGGVLHQDGLEPSRVLLGVARGQPYIRQTEGMARSFLKHNPGWDVAEYYDDQLVELLPQKARAWSAFDHCEIGRWSAMQRLLDRYDTVLYCDGDVRWYDARPDWDPCTIRLFPHHHTPRALIGAKHWTLVDGAANIGIMEVSSTPESPALFDFIIGEVLHDSTRFRRHGKLWLQPLVSTIEFTGMGARWDRDPGMNVARWNIVSKDRWPIERDGRLLVECAGREFPLRTMHFSAKSIGQLESFSPLCAKLVRDYRRDWA